MQRAIVQQHLFCLARNARRYSGTASEAKDIVILGGGVAGLALAVALGRNKVIRQTYKVTLLESSDLKNAAKWSLPEDSYSNRVVSVTNQSRQFLERIGAWQHVEQSRTREVCDMQVWDGISGSRIHLDSHAIPKDAQLPPKMATMTEIPNLQKALLTTIDRKLSTHVEITDQTKVQQISKEEDSEWPLVELSNGKTLRPRLLIGADGPNSPVRKYANIGTTGWMYNTHGFVATMNVSAPFLGENDTAFQRFLPTGPIAYLPLPDDRASLVWSTRPEIAARLKQLDSETLAALVNAAFQLPWSSISYLYAALLDGTSNEDLREAIEWRSSYEVLGPDAMPSPFSAANPPEVLSIQEKSTASFPLRYSHADVYLGETPAGKNTANRTTLVGDAAHSMHPLAGQGLNAGFGDVAALCQTLEDAVAKGMDIGTLTALKGYPRARWSANHNLMSAVDKLHKLYSREETPVVWARSVGLEMVNEIAPVKKFFMRQAGAGSAPTLSNSNRVLHAGAQLYVAANSAKQIAGMLWTVTRNNLTRR